jgi:membrane fusion protein (multidrug efflux system)
MSATEGLQILPESPAQGAKINGGSVHLGPEPSFAKPALNPSEPGASRPAPSIGPAIPPAKPPRRSAKRFVLLGALGLLATGGGYVLYDWYWLGRFNYTTDDAYIKADTSILAAKVSGYVTAVPVKENEEVKAGDLILAIDDGDYKLAVDAAKAKLATQQATIDRLSRQVEAQKAVVAQSEAEIGAAQAEEERAAADLERAVKLLKTQFSTQQTLDQARADHTKAVSALANARAAKDAANANLAVAQAQQIEAERTKSELQTALDKAERDLNFTEVRAPVDGVVANKEAQVGAYVQAGTRLLSVVPMSSVYIEANFKETQLGRIKPGQTATISVDALLGLTLKGVVESIAPASGSEFSMLPPENATGNFTKIVQRVPVRIKIPAEALQTGDMRPGLSVVVDVDTASAANDGQTKLARQ